MKVTATIDAAVDAVSLGQIAEVTAAIVEQTAAVDVHTHLFQSRFGALGQSGIDNLLTYHYLEAELFRFSSIQPDEYWALPQTERAERIWKTLFVENAPISEATRGVIAVLQALGFDTMPAKLDDLREQLRGADGCSHTHRVLELAGVSSVVMTNDPLDPQEIPYWTDSVQRQDVKHQEIFRASLRLDRILNHWSNEHGSLASQGYSVSEDLSGNSLAEVRRFLEDWAKRMDAVYMAVSLPPTFAYPADDVRNVLLTRCVLPACGELGIPLTLMIGVRRQVNPALRLAGDGLGRADLTALERLCLDFPRNRFMVSVLSRENQHELCVLARKFSNLTPFGCWWFLNNDSIVEEITRERLEMLGATFIAQNSDARVLEQLIYKWRNTRRTLAPLIAARFTRLVEDGRPVTRAEIQEVVSRLLSGNFHRLVGGS